MAKDNKLKPLISAWEVRKDVEGVLFKDIGDGEKRSKKAVLRNLVLSAEILCGSHKIKHLRVSGGSARTLTRTLSFRQIASRIRKIFILYGISKWLRLNAPGRDWVEA